jgi:hypothetical protein
MASVFTNPGEIREQKVEKVKKAGRPLAAAGAAAVLFASLAVFVAPIDTARAASATNVNVVNPAAEPALTRNVDDPGRIAYQSTAVCVLGGNFCTFDFPAVPKNRRLVVEHVSVSLVGNPTGPTGAQVNLSGGANQAATLLLAPPSFLGASQFDQPVLQYFDAGSAPFLFATADVTLSSVSIATLSGYLLDCATTPCAAIAQ